MAVFAAVVLCIAAPLDKQVLKATYVLQLGLL